MEKITIGKQQFNSSEELINWVQIPEVSKRIDELLNNDRNLFNYFMMLFYKQIINVDKKPTHFEFKYLPRTNQSILEFEYLDGEKYTQLSPTKEEMEEALAVAIELFNPKKRS